MSRQRNARFSVSLVFVAILVLAGCDPDALGLNLDGPARPQQNEVSNVSGQAPDYIVLGSFNMARFGRSKHGNPSVMKYLIKIVRRFDIIALQEIQDSSQLIIPDFVKQLNADGGRFDFVAGPRQGGRMYKEQYVFIYDTEKLELASQPFVVNDLTREIDRPPFVAHFRCRNLPPGEAFTFALMNIHTDPDEIKDELPALKSAVEQVRLTMGGREDDVILIGDLNAPPRYFQQFDWFQNQLPIIHDDWATNTRGDRNYDNIVFNSWLTREFKNQSGVFDFAQEYGLIYDNAKQVSDHRPVWGVFSTREASSATAAQAPNPNGNTVQ